MGWGFLKSVGSAIGSAAKSTVSGVKAAGSGIARVGKKVGKGVAHVASVAKKVSGHIAGIAKKVGSISGDIAAGAGVVAAGAGMLGPEMAPIVAGALGVAGAAKTVQGAAALTGDVAGDVNRGIDRGEAVVKAAGGVVKAAQSGNLKGAVSQGVGLYKGVQHDVKTVQNKTRSTIQRGKDLRQQVKS